MSKTGSSSAAVAVVVIVIVVVVAAAVALDDKSTCSKVEILFKSDFLSRLKSCQRKTSFFLKLKFNFFSFKMKKILESIKCVDFFQIFTFFKYKISL